MASELWHRPKRIKKTVQSDLFKIRKSDLFFRISYFLVCILQRNQIVRHAQPTAKYNQLVVDVKQFFIKCAHVVDPFSTVLPPMTFVCDRYCWIHAFITKSTFVWPCFLHFFWFTLKLVLLILGWKVESIWKHISSTILTWRVLSLAILTWSILMGWALTFSPWDLSRLLGRCRHFLLLKRFFIWCSIFPFCAVRCRIKLLPKQLPISFQHHVVITFPC